jgi:glyoxylase-like metal-dependent hydrolase (beta-lactamase superfamily II)
MEDFMRQITPDIYLLEGLRVSNVYLLAAPEGLTLVDTGMAATPSRMCARW